MNRTDRLAKDLQTIFGMMAKPLPSDDLEEVIRLEGGREMDEAFFESIGTGDFSKLDEAGPATDDAGEQPPSL